MKINFITIGKEHDLKEAIQNYTQRASRYFSIEWKIIGNVKNAASLPIDILKDKEAQLILSMIKDDEYLITLDEKGTMLSSEGLAKEIEKLQNNRKKVVHFLIGGAFGVNETVINRSNFVWSLSKLVFPHQLVRLILAEQVYRACTILKNEKYHHS